MLDPELVCAAVYQIAAPLKNIIVVSVTRKDGMSNTIVQMPFMTPIRMPTTTIDRIATAGAHGCPARYPPSLVMTEAPTTQPIAMIEVADRSIWATIRTIMRPKAAMNSG